MTNQYFRRDFRLLAWDPELGIPFPNDADWSEANAEDLGNNQYRFSMDNPTNTSRWRGMFIRVRLQRRHSPMTSHFRRSTPVQRQGRGWRSPQRFTSSGTSFPTLDAGAWNALALSDSRVHS